MLFFGNISKTESDKERNKLTNLKKSKMAVLWVVVPCSLVEVYQRFRGPDGGSKDL
jgi:hypothetical protein